jgi:hypothetical protein
MSLRHSITGGFILCTLFNLPAQACSDDSCYPTWDLKRDLLDTCNNTPFLSPANDSRVNLQLLLADYARAPLTTQTADNYYKDQGYAQVPFPIDLTDEAETPALAQSAQPSPLTAQALQLGVTSEAVSTLLTENNSWEGSRCASNNQQTALIYLQQLSQATDIPAEEHTSELQSRT